MKTKPHPRNRLSGISRGTAHTTIGVVLFLLIKIVEAFGKSDPNTCLSTTAEATSLAGADCGSETISGNGISARIVSGQIQTSVDGVVWTEQGLAVRTFLRGITWGKGMFVAVGGSYVDVPGVIITSRDGITWIRRNPHNKHNLYGVTYGNDMFVAVGDAGTICTSVDGFTWKAQRSRSATHLAAVASGNGLFVAGGELGLILVSKDAVHWTSACLMKPLYVGTVNFGAGTFTVSDRSGVLASTNGIIWFRQRPEGVARAPSTSPNNFSRSTPNFFPTEIKPTENSPEEQ